MREDPAEGLLLLGESMVTGSPSSFIEGQERSGQAQLVNSDRLPTDHGNDAPWLALGFTFGDPDPDDPLFMPATLPAGWKRQASEHAMGSVIVDMLGRERVSVFYKAAFYDRKAHMRLVSLYWYVACHVEYDGPLAISDEWATREAVLAVMREHRAENLREAAEFRGFAADTVSRDKGNRDGCAKIASEKEATAAKYEAAITGLEAETAARG
jgi:hypothetical protein